MIPSLAVLAATAGLAGAYTVTNVDRFMYKNIDPIVVPGQYKSHLHTFFGSDAVTLNTTTSAELQAGCSTAVNPNDYSIYWVPTLIYTNSTGHKNPVPLFRFSAYYVNIQAAEIAIPQDFRSVAGNSSATSPADIDSSSGVEWFCDYGTSGDDKPDAAAFPTKTCDAHLQTLLLFHDCVDPATLASAYSGTHNWNTTFRPENRCPEGMSRIPQLRFSIRYDLRKALPEGWSGPAPLELACGSSYCSHGDFINGWLPEAAENMLLANSKSEFAGVDGPNGAYNAGSICDRTATDADPDNGTSDFEEAAAILLGNAKRMAQIIARRSSRVMRGVGN